MTHLSPRTLPKDKRLRKRRDFLRVQRFGSRYFGRFIVAVAERCRDNENGQIGFTVPKKVGKAHERNLVKRRLRHIMRINADLFLEKRLVLVARDNAFLASYEDLFADVTNSCRKLTMKHTQQARNRTWTRKVA